MDEFPKKLNLFKLVFSGDKSIYKYDSIPEECNVNEFSRKGNVYYSLKDHAGNQIVDFDPYLIRKLIDNEFKNKLKSNGYELQGRYNAYKTSSETDYGIFKLFDGFEYRFIPIKNDLFLSIDFKLVIKTSASIEELSGVSEDLLLGSSVELKDPSLERNKGKLIEICNDECIVKVYGGNLESISSSIVYPLCRPERLRLITGETGNFVDVVGLQRKKSLFHPRRRFSKIRQIVKSLNAENIFPLTIENMTIEMLEEFLPIEEVGYSTEFSPELEPYDTDTSYDGVTLKCDEKLDEPILEFYGGDSHTKPFPTNYPPYSEVENISIRFYFPKEKLTDIQQLIRGLDMYLTRYYNASNVDIDLNPLDNDALDARYVEEIKHSLEHYLRFNDRFEIGVVYVPESMKYRHNSPYYTLKAHFASLGIPTQMITDKSFARSPYSLNYTWFNMCTAIVAKCGGIPWVLKERLEETDIIIGMSSSARLSNIGEDVHENRYVGFANVFNKYGRWCYFCGTANEYDSSAALDQIKEILDDIERYYSTNEYISPKNIVIHNSKRMRYDFERRVYEVVKELFGNDCQCAFITIDESHNYRCFDLTSGDGSLSRGYFIYLNNKEILLSTTGKSELGKRLMGTPRVLHIIAHQYPDKFLSLENVAKQVLALTKLNWASITPVQREPVTINYANRLAKIAANIGSEDWKKVGHPLFNRPWFI